jgi:hypothetical protein
MMKRVGVKMSSLLLCASALIGASCESETKVGSECEDGVCPRANSVTQQTCLVSSMHVEIGIVNDDENGILWPEEQAICLGRARPIDEHGDVGCTMRWSLGAGSAQPPSSAPKRCTDAPFLEPAEQGVDDVCIVAQLTGDDIAAGDDGWFYEDNGSCTYGSGAGVRFTAGARPPTGTTLELFCARAQTTDTEGEPVDIDVAQCELADSREVDIGAACMPKAVPADGFDPREASVEVGSDQCESEACLVYMLDGDPRPECEAGDGRVCPTQSEIDRSIYCSCRCDAPEGDPGPLCDCVDGFTCVEAIPDAPPGIRGSYCVRNESVPL